MRPSLSVAMPISIVAVAIIAILSAAMYSSSSTSGGPFGDIFKTPTVAVSRLLDCTDGGECSRYIVDRQATAKYPQLEDAMALAYEQYGEFQMLCETNDCLEQQWISSIDNDHRIKFTTTKEKIFEISGYLQENGAALRSIANHGGGHSLRLTLDDTNAVYAVEFSYPVR